MTKKVWGGRFSQEPDALVNMFNASISFDRHLYAYDIEGSVAHCRMLAKQGIISDEDASAMLVALGEIKRELDHGGFSSDDDYEDIHTLVEKAMVEKVGALGEKIHTGRSRNDQVALDTRLYVRDAVQQVMVSIRDCQRTILRLAEDNFAVLMPGYTHLQRAQPVLLSHHLMAYYEMLNRDHMRFEESLDRVNVMPLGSAALAGATFDLDREMVAEELGFDRISRNSMDAVSDRDFILDFIYACSVCAMHLSRFCEEIILWSSNEFNMVTLSDSYSTGSSIMPQKKNPDMAELIRGKTGRVYGDLMSLLTVMKGLPLAYNKDMQEDKEALFDAYDTMAACLPVFTGMMQTATWNKAKMKASAGLGFTNATDAADYLTKKGLAFRDAHEVVGKLVLMCEQNGKAIDELSIEDLKSLSPMFEGDVFDALSLETCVDKRNVYGGPSADSVKKHIELMIKFTK